MITEEQEKIIALYASANEDDHLLAQTLENSQNIDLTDFWKGLEKLYYGINLKNAYAKKDLLQLMQMEPVTWNVTEKSRHFPPSISYLHNMERLFIYNKFNKSIKTVFIEQFMYLKKLNSLNLRCNGQYIDDSIMYCRQVEYLTVGGCDLRDSGDCKLDSINPLIGRFKKLRILEIKATPFLRHLPITLGNLCSLQRLYIGDCARLQRLPETIGLLKKLKKVVLENVALRQLPDSFAKLQGLEELEIVDCDFLEKLPENIGALANLKIFRLRQLECVDLPDTLVRMGSLLELHISDMPNLTQLPKGMAAMAQLKSIRIHNCPKLTDIWESIQGLESLQELNITDTPITEVPASIGSCLNLQKLHIYMNSAIRVDDALCNLHHLQELNLFTNDNAPKYSLQLPDRWNEMRALKKIYFRGVQLGGKLPDSMGLLPNLECLQVLFAGLETLPPDVSGWGYLRELTVSYNQLRALPPNMGLMKCLTELDVANNKLSHIPDEIGLLASLKVCQISNNNVTYLPDSIVNCALLNELYIRGNPIKNFPDGLPPHIPRMY